SERPSGGADCRADQQAKDTQENSIPLKLRRDDMFKTLHSLHRWIAVAALTVSAGAAHAACLDNIVLVHGNAGSPSNWNSTVSTLKSRGYTDSQLYRPNWGSKTCPACNDHNSSNTNVVKTALQQAKAASCTGKIDVIGHS